MRAPLYDITPDVFLFPKIAGNDGVTNSREEPVRQWCAFELIRAYGIKVSDLNFEAPVKIGSGTKRIDILVKRDGKPWIVVECKESKHKQHAKGLEQAVSYANAEGIRAEFAVYTNGKEWRAKRFVGGTWHDVTDIPNLNQTNALGSMDALLFSLDAVAPILHKLDEPLSGREARVFFEALQGFFIGPNLLTDTVDRDLKIGTDLVLRVISNEPNEEHYFRSKLNSAAQVFEGYIARTGIGHPIGEMGNERIGMFATFMATGLDPIREAGQSNGSLNDELIRLIIGLLRYLRSQTETKEKYPTIPSTVHDPLRRFLTKSLALNLNLKLPDALEADITSDVKITCGDAWDKLMAHEMREQREFEKGLPLGLWQKLAFWRKRP